ncbi:MAG TPA: hypothetical protein VJN64_00495 [Terriglobales bacterium]|nr:hypothetical protein [Terriglobales bacterium]
MRLQSFLLPLALLLTVAASAGQKPADKPETLRSTIPAGYEIVKLQPSGTELFLLGLIECPELEGAQRVSEGSHARIVAADGSSLDHFPRFLNFRITASLRKELLDSSTDGSVTAQDPREFILKLGFTLRDYDGLQLYELHPQSVEIIGVPADVPYDERVFRVSFDIGSRPISDRFVLEVLSPESARIARFHFELL